MKIAFTLPQLEPYSPRGLALSTIVHEVSRQLVLQGHSVMVFTITDPLGVYPEPTVVQVPGAHSWSRVSRKLARLVRRPTRTVEDRWRRAVAESIAAHRERIDVVVSMNDVEIHREIARVAPATARVPWLQNELGDEASIAAAIRSVDQVLCCSQFIAQTVARRAGGIRTAVVHSGVNTDEFQADALPNPGARPRLLFVGRLDPNKGPDALVAAATAAAARGITSSVTVAGPPISYSLVGLRYDDWLDRLMKDLGAIGGRFVGRVERHDLPALYHEHDATFVLSRADEPFGLVALEAMASGNLVVTSGRGGLVEATGGHAIEVDPDDVSAITRVIDQLAHNDQGLEDRRLAGARWASTRDWSLVATELVSALEP